MAGETSSEMYFTLQNSQFTEDSTRWRIQTGKVTWRETYQLIGTSLFLKKAALSYHFALSIIPVSVLQVSALSP